MGADQGELKEIETVSGVKWKWNFYLCIGPVFIDISSGDLS